MRPSTPLRKNKSDVSGRSSSFLLFRSMNSFPFSAVTVRIWPGASSYFNKIGKFLFVGFADRRVFVITVGLAGDDLPVAVPTEPSVGHVITRLQVLTEDGFGFISVVAQNRSVANDPADNVVDLDGARISGRERGDVGDEFGFIEGTALFVGESGIVCEIFFPRGLVSGNNRVVEFLRSPDELGFRDGQVGGTEEDREQQAEDS